MPSPLPVLGALLLLGPVLVAIPSAPARAQDAPRAERVPVAQRVQTSTGSEPAAAPTYRLSSAWLEGGSAAEPGSAPAAALGGVLGTGGAILAGLAAMNAANCEGDFCELLPGAIAYGAVALFAVPAGVTLGGNMTGGRGTYWGAFAGTVAGALLGGALVFALSALHDDIASYAEVAVALGAPILGAVLGYRLSAIGRSPATTQPRNALAGLRPGISLDVRTGTGALSVSGVF